MTWREAIHQSLPFENSAKPAPTPGTAGILPAASSARMLNPGFLSHMTSKDVASSPPAVRGRYCRDLAVVARHVIYTSTLTRFDLQRSTSSSTCRRAHFSALSYCCRLAAHGSLEWCLHARPRATHATRPPGPCSFQLNLRACSYTSAVSDYGTLAAPSSSVGMVSTLAMALPRVRVEGGGSLIDARAAASVYGYTGTL